MTGEEVFTRDRSSGRIHRRFKMPDGNLASAEADNLDDAGASDEITAATVDAADPADLCGRCFPSTIPDAAPGSGLLDVPAPGGDMWPGPGGYQKAPPADEVAESDSPDVQGQP